MSRGRAALLLASAMGLPLAGSLVAAPAASASLAVGAPEPRQAVILVADGTTFDALLAVPAFRTLARAGGAGLMTTYVPPGGDRESSTYLTIGAGAPISDPSATNRALIVRALFLRNGVGVRCSVDTAGADPTVAQRLPLMVANVVSGCGPRGLAMIGRSSIRFVGLPASPSAVGARAAEVLQGLPEESTLVMVVVPSTSAAMDASGDLVTPLVMAEGMPSSLRSPAAGLMHGLTSDTTRQDGLVANVDVAPTVLRFFGAAIPAEMDGEPIHVTDDLAPFDLYHRELQYRRTRLPVQAGEGVFVWSAGVVLIWALVARARRRPIGGRTSAAIRYLTLAGATLPAVVLSGGLLPSFAYAVVVPYMLVMTFGIPIVALAARRLGRMEPFRLIGAVTLALLVVDLALGSRALRIPLEGGTMFDGARFYGMPNLANGPLLAGVLFLAAGWEPYAGFVALVAAGFLAGFPSLGADVGGSITLFAAAGLWWGLASRGRIGPRELALTAGVTVAGLAAVLLASRYLPGAPTHATRFVERTGGRLSALFDTVRHRLGIGARLIIRRPDGLTPLVGLPVLGWVVAARPGGLREALDDPRWRHVILVLLAAGAVAYFANDTGSTAAGPMFLYGIALTAYLALSPTPAAAGRDAPVGGMVP